MLTPRVKKIRDLWYIVSRNVFLLTNGVILTVVALLFVFGDRQAGLFLGLVTVINMLLGLGQDIRAWRALEKLQLLTAPHVNRIRDGVEESVLTEDVRKGDMLRLGLGDQIPCDGVLVSSESLELNEGLITGESTSLPRGAGERVLAGSIITSGAGLMRAETVFAESRIARMTEGVQRSSVAESPIQKSVNMVIRYSGYVLVVVIAFAVLRGVMAHESNVNIVKHVGALASVIVAQGLAFGMTLLFAYGAAHLFRRHVLLQEVNATEKLGRIKNLCLDKTGTLCENGLTAERFLSVDGAPEAKSFEYMTAYLDGTNDTSQTALAVRKLLTNDSFKGVKIDGLPFSSWRRFGAVSFRDVSGDTMVLVVGAAEVMIPQLIAASEQSWLQDILSREAREGNRLLCIALSDGMGIPQDIAQSKLSLLGVFVLSSRLRPGIREAIEFFQKRGVRIRILSGDHAETVRAIARSAGVLETDSVVSGADIDQWTEEEFGDRVRNTTIFARIFPEQKERIVEALKDDGFTAMVGDGANDALALKKSDLGIAMFEGAPATRQVASIVLTNNSFTALPGGVELADSIIKNAEIFASIFFSFSFTGFFLFVWVSILGYAFPLTPLNMTLINYFTIGFPSILISYWTIRPAGKAVAAHAGNFLRKVLPFVVSSSLLQAVALGFIFALSGEQLKNSPSNFLIVLASLILGFIFFLFVPRVFRGKLAPSEMRDLVLLALFEAILLPIALHVPLVLRFFEIDIPPISPDASVRFSLVLFVYTLLQYVLARWFARGERD
ncbi:MAG: HAD-IC family P-type ATPase [Candidatus Moraniibacteriota bacterium]|nr:MAG: HAD-IC family P-type ATPase [Candidatus Moranbacteria bacterium]